MPRCPALNALFRPVVWHEWTLQMGYMRPAPTRPAVPALLTPAKHSSPQHLPSFVVGNKKRVGAYPPAPVNQPKTRCGRSEDRKSTRLNSSHVAISYAVFCLKQ